MIRPQEKWAKKTVVQRVKRVQISRSQQGAQPSADALLKAVMLPKQCQIGPEIYAINRFYADYAFTIASCQFLYLVQPLWGGSKTPSSIHSVVPAVALANVAQKLGRHDLMEQADRHYGRALKKLADSLNNPEVSKHDGTLLTALMLSLYETISHNRYKGTQNIYRSHVSGRRALIKLRGREQLETASGRTLFIIMHHEQLVSSFITDTEPSEEFNSWIYGAFPPSTILTLELLMHDTSSFLALLKRILSQEPKPHPQEIIRLIRTGLRLHEMALDLSQFYLTGDADRSETLRFYTEALATRRPSHSEKINLSMLEKILTVHEPTETKTAEDMPTTEPDAVLDPDARAAYGKPTQSSALNLCRAMHIHLAQGMLKAITHLNLTPGHEEAFQDVNPALDLTALDEEFNATISQHAIDIYFDTPAAIDGEKGSPVTEFTLRGNAFRAYVMLWPLRAALNASQTSAKYKVLLARRLKEINKVHGIGMAVELVAMAKDLPDDNEVLEDLNEAHSPSYPKANLGSSGSCPSQCFCFFKH